MSHDIDVLVRPADIRRAFEVLLDGGWQAASGVGRLRLQAYASGYRAMNFLKGQYGDIDLHQIAYHPIHVNGADEEGLWARSLGVDFYGIQARVPAASDRVAMAIAHGALDAHAHSDWLVDIDSTIRRYDPNWDDLLATLSARRILVPAAATLSYLAMELSSPVPPAVLHALLSRADRQGWPARLSLLECKPRTDFNSLSRVARGVAKQVRHWRGKKNAPRVESSLWRARLSGRSAGGATPSGSSAVFPVSAGRTVALKIVIAVDLPSLPRRIDFELSTRTRHLAVLRYRKISRFGGRRTLTFRGTIQLASDEDQLIVDARPSRFSRHPLGEEELRRFGALPFAVVGVEQVEAAPP